MQVYDGRSLVVAMHRAGINLRYLGALSQMELPEHLSTLITSEMVGRLLKQELNTHWRAVEYGNLVGQRECVVRTLNSCFSPDDSDDALWWSQCIAGGLLERYGCELQLTQVTSKSHCVIFISHHSFVKLKLSPAPSRAVFAPLHYTCTITVVPTVTVELPLVAHEAEALSDALPILTHVLLGKTSLDACARDSLSTVRNPVRSRFDLVSSLRLLQTERHCRNSAAIEVC